MISEEMEKFLEALKKKGITCIGPSVDRPLFIFFIDGVYFFVSRYKIKEDLNKLMELAEKFGIGEKIKKMVTRRSYLRVFCDVTWWCPEDIESFEGNLATGKFVSFEEYLRRLNINFLSIAAAA